MSESCSLPSVLCFDKRRKEVTTQGQSAPKFGLFPTTNDFVFRNYDGDKRTVDVCYHETSKFEQVVLRATHEDNESDEVYVKEAAPWVCHGKYFVKLFGCEPWELPVPYTIWIRTTANRTEELKQVLEATRSARKDLHPLGTFNDMYIVVVEGPSYTNIWSCHAKNKEQTDALVAELKASGNYNAVIPLPVERFMSSIRGMRTTEF